MNLGDPELELLDPTPNIHALFIHFDKLFFWTSLMSRTIVRWSKRMYSCAGTCSYDRVMCTIALSEPLLKLRPRKDLTETLLHEMIHAYLFITNKDRDRDGHGPNFKAHMHRINKSAGLNISIYHDFHDEVKLYQTHWWRCNGPCQSKRPHFGIVRRSANRAPGPSDYWWLDHQRKCGGTFVKIKEPEPKNQKKLNKQNKQNGDIKKYINSKKTGDNIIDENNKIKSVLKDSNYVVKPNKIIKTNNSSTLVVTKKNVVFNPKETKVQIPFSGSGQILGSKTNDNLTDVTETVRSIWANKFITSQDNNLLKNTSKHKINTSFNSPPKKSMKIDDYFKNSAKTVLKDLYGQDFIISEKIKDSKLHVIPIKSDLVDCPVCHCKMKSTEINGHLDECLNKDLINKISEDANFIIETNQRQLIDSDPYMTQINPRNNEKSDVKDTKPYLTNEKGDTQPSTHIKHEKDFIDLTKVKYEIDNNNVEIKKESSSTSNVNICPCCGKNVSKPIEEHLDECLMFFDNNETIPEEGASTSAMIDTIVLDSDDDDDKFDETLTLNATGTKSPCPCCLQMIEQSDMNEHLDICLS